MPISLSAWEMGISISYQLIIRYHQEVGEGSGTALTNERWELSHAVYTVDGEVVTLFRK